MVARTIAGKQGLCKRYVGDTEKSAWSSATRSDSKLLRLSGFSVVNFLTNVRLLIIFIPEQHLWRLLQITPMKI